MFKRENRYLVIKRKDIDAYIESQVLKNDLEDLCTLINMGRSLDGKSTLRCVVIEEDWPEYETVWKMLEDRVNNERRGTS